MWTFIVGYFNAILFKSDWIARDWPLIMVSSESATEEKNIVCIQVLPENLPRFNCPPTDSNAHSAEFDCIADKEEEDEAF